MDGAGNVYISSYSNGQVFKETWSAGSYTQSTVTASGLGQPGGVAVDGSGNIYISDTSNNRVLKESTLGAQTVVGSGLSYPAGAGGGYERKSLYRRPGK